MPTGIHQRDSGEIERGIIPMIYCKRVYDASSSQDGYRILVDRLWPRGIKKTDLQWVELSRDVLELLDQDLSHIEFSCEAGHTLKMVQEYKNKKASDKLNKK